MFHNLVSPHIDVETAVAPHTYTQPLAEIYSDVFVTPFRLTAGSGRVGRFQSLRNTHTNFSGTYIHEIRDICILTTLNVYTDVEWYMVSLAYSTHVVYSPCCASSADDPLEQALATSTSDNSSVVSPTAGDSIQDIPVCIP